MDALVLTLGHNSSAIYVKNGNIIFGIEEERLSEIKSDSSFPRKAIAEIRRQCEIDKFDAIFIGHWFLNAELVKSKYYDYDECLDLLKIRDERFILSLNNDFSHHDSHNHSAIAFAVSQHMNLFDSTLSVVIDGFGTAGEVMSFYDVTGHESKLLKRYFGFGSSIGLFYQYSTLYQGMKMHNHEYKMLGYEARIHEYFPADVIDEVDVLCNNFTVEFIENLGMSAMTSLDPIVDSSALEQMRVYVFKFLDKVKDKVSPLVKIITEDQMRVLFSYVTQRVTEDVVMSVLEPLGKHFSQIIFSGGVFYNVKLNNLILNSFDKVCFMPIAGDQGAGLGVYQRYQGDLSFPPNLLWAKRDINKDLIAEYNNNRSTPGKIYFVHNDNEAIENIASELEAFGAVNVVGRYMEFGPRALGGTSTIALPDKAIVGKINKMNNRTSIMPMAPMMTLDQAKTICPTIKKVVGSDKFMITSHDIEKADAMRISGACNHYLDAEGLIYKSTCRPQIVSDNVFHNLCNKLGPLINTSFNYHGVPIVYTTAQIIDSHDKQNAKDIINTIIMDY